MEAGELVDLTDCMVLVADTDDPNVVLLVFQRPDEEAASLMVKVSKEEVKW